MLNQARIMEEAAALGVALAPPQTVLLDAYCAAIAEANQSINLTAITEPREVEVKHVLDCLALCAAPELRGSVADVGTGAGFPGVVLKIANPALDVTLIDATAKKLHVIERVCAGIGVDITAVHGRAEELARGAYREAFDTATARAVAPLGALVELALPLVRVGGWLLAMKGPEAQAELADSQYAIGQLGGGHAIVENFALPGGIRRAVVKIKKISQTPSKYPRNGKNITKNQLKNR